MCQSEWITISLGKRKKVNLAASVSKHFTVGVGGGGGLLLLFLPLVRIKTFFC